MTDSSSNLADQLDRERLLNLYLDDTEMMISSMEMFLDEVLPGFVVLERFIEQQDWEAVTGLTHQMRPWLGMVGMTNLENRLWDIEKMAKANPDRETVLILCTNFNEKLAQMSSVLKMELHELTKGM